MLTAILRTVVPALWGSFIAWLIGVAPLLAPFETDLKGLAQVALPVITALIIGAWYALWRWLQPRLPGWVTRAVLGSAKTPTYVPPVAVNPTSASSDEAARIAAQSLDRVDGPDHRA